MKFSEIAKEAIALLQDSGRVSYRALKVEFDLTDDLLDILKAELIDIQEAAVDKDGKIARAHTAITRSSSSSLGIS